MNNKLKNQVLVGNYMRVKFLIIAYLVVNFLTACASFSGYPDREISTDDVIPVLKREEVVKCMDEQDNDTSRACRNKIISAGMLVIDINFSDFEKQLFKENREASFVTTVATLGLTAAGAMTGTAVLSAISTGLIGSKAAFDSEVLMDKAILAIHTQMRAQRYFVAARLRRGFKENTTDYPLALAIVDIEAYYNAGTLLTAFIEITESAGVKAKKAKEDFSKAAGFRTSVFTKDEAGDLIREFWKPDGNNVDKKNQKQIRDWFTKNNIKEISITFFLRSELFEPFRQKMAKDFNLL